MRISKFRAKSFDNIWRTGHIAFSKDLTQASIAIDKHPGAKIYQVYPNTVSQFVNKTGTQNEYMTDRNNVEICEYDYVKCYPPELSPKYGIILFVDGCFEINFKLPVFSSMKKRDYLKVYVGNHALEVIGNKFDNFDINQLMEESK